MRNVTIWKFYGPEHNPKPEYVRMFVYKGVRRTLNEFMYPAFVFRDGGLFPRNNKSTLPCVGYAFADKKGQAVLMGYSTAQYEDPKSPGEIHYVFNSLEEAVAYLIKQGYRFYGDESATARRRKAKVQDLVNRHEQYVQIANSVEASGYLPPRKHWMNVMVDDSPSSLVIKKSDYPELHNAVAEIGAEHPGSVVSETEFTETPARAGIWQNIKKFFGF